MAQVLRDNIITGSHALYPYLVAEVKIQYSTSTNKAAVKGVGPTGGTTRIINLSGPVTRKSVTFEFVRLNAAPDLPYISSVHMDNVEDVVETSDIQVSAPTLHSDGQSQVYQAAGKVVYICQTIHDPANSIITFPMSPVDANREQIASINPRGSQNNNSFNGGGFNATWPPTPVQGVQTLSSSSTDNTAPGPTN